MRFDIAWTRTKSFTSSSKRVLPILKKQDGFKDELLLVDNHTFCHQCLEERDAVRKYESMTYQRWTRRFAGDDRQATVETFEYDRCQPLNDRGSPGHEEKRGPIGPLFSGSSGDCNLHFHETQPEGSAPAHHGATRSSRVRPSAEGPVRPSKW